MVEMAIALPVLMLVVLGIVQFGILFNNYLTLTDAVRAGARQAAVSRLVADPAAAATRRVQLAAGGSLDVAKLQVAVSAYDPATSATAFAQGGDVTVTATYPYSINLLGLVVKQGQLTSSTTERVE